MAKELMPELNNSVDGMNKLASEGYLVSDIKKEVLGKIPAEGY